MMWRTYFRKAINSIAILVTAFGFVSSNATASWIFIGDIDLTDSATNPGYPHDESAATVGAYLQDLLNLASAPALRGQEDTYDGSALSGLGNPTPPSSFLLSFHFGNGNRFWNHDGPFDVFFACTSGCDTFALPDTQGISNYREYGGTPVRPQNDVPEPGTLALLACSLLALMNSRRSVCNTRARS